MQRFQKWQTCALQNSTNYFHSNSKVNFFLSCYLIQKRHLCTFVANKSNFLLFFFKLRKINSCIWVHFAINVFLSLVCSTDFVHYLLHLISNWSSWRSAIASWSRIYPWYRSHLNFHNTTCNFMNFFLNYGVEMKTFPPEKKIVKYYSHENSNATSERTLP